MVYDFDFSYPSSAGTLLHAAKLLIYKTLMRISLTQYNYCQLFVNC